MKRLTMLVCGVLASAGVWAAVNINTATVAELEAVKGLGPGKAKAIVDYRTQHGPYKSVDDLKAVKGFGDKSVDKLRPELTVGSGQAAAR